MGWAALQASGAAGPEHTAPVVLGPSCRLPGKQPGGAPTEHGHRWKHFSQAALEWKKKKYRFTITVPHDHKVNPAVDRNKSPWDLWVRTGLLHLCKCLNLWLLLHCAWTWLVRTVRSCAVHTLYFTGLLVTSHLFCSRVAESRHGGCVNGYKVDMENVSVNGREWLCCLELFLMMLEMLCIKFSNGQEILFFLFHH